jgi:hypothetical protein
MGFSGTYLYDGRRWMSQERGQRPEVAEPWLMVDVHDSDFTAITYCPAGPGNGVAYLGRAPRGTLKGDKTWTAADIEREAGGLVSWWARIHGSVDETGLEAKKRQIAEYLSGDGGSAEVKPGDGGQRDAAELFAELKTSRFLVALDLPVPDELVS